LDFAPRDGSIVTVNAGECNEQLSSGIVAVWQSGTGVPPVNHAQDARATFKLYHHGKFVGGNGQRA